MTKYKLKIRLTALVLSLIIVNAASAAEGFKNENKNIGSGDSVSNADLTGHAGSNFGFTINTRLDSKVNHQQQFVNDVRTYHQMEERRRQLQEDQLKAYKRYMQSRKQRPGTNNSIPADVQARQEEYIKHMNERRALIKKMMDERRKAAQERQEAQLQKMHQTSTTSAMADKT